MKRIAATVGLAAISAAGIQSIYGQQLIPSTTDTSKAWSISAAVRGFYDDNIATQPSGPNKVDSFGFEINPFASYALRMEQTDVSLAYSYSYKYFDKTPPNQLDHDSQTHIFNGLVDHRFNERLKADVQDSFVVGQEGDVLAVPTMPYTTPQRIPGNNIRNYGSTTVDGELTPELGLELGYANSWYSYADSDSYLITQLPSNSGMLDRLEHMIHLDARWQLEPENEMVVLAGYQFGLVDYTGNQVINGPVPGTSLNINQDSNTQDTRYSDSRNNRSQYAYVGLERKFLPNLFASGRVGVRYTDNYNANNTEWAPYAKGNIRYSFEQEGWVELGVAYDRSTSDFFTFNQNNGSFSLDSDATVVYANLKKRLLPDLYGGLSGTFQYDNFNGGIYNNQSDKIYLMGVNLEYRITRNFLASAGYSYDMLSSDVAGVSFHRNRVFIGATVTY